MKYSTTSLKFIITFFVLASCTEAPEEVNHLRSEIQEIQSEFAPDKRVALFDVVAEKKEKTYILKGESDMADAISALKAQLKAQKIDFIDSIQLLPAFDLDGLTYAVVNISVANLRSKPKHSAELATQATLGTPVKVLKNEGGWYYIQTPDKYLSWVDAGGITLMNDQQFQDWKSQDKIIYTKTYGHAYEAVNEKNIVSDVVAGAILQLVKLTENYFVVAYPDGRIAMVRFDEAENYFGWINDMNRNPENLVETSKKLMGVPYLWGGTSTKGMDCSGFTKTIYFLNGMVIPRDASQQVNTGKQVDDNQNFNALEKGDLLFFGRKATDAAKEKVVHVGMWIGNNEFIHASDMVRVSSMNPEADNYDAYNLKRYLRSKRMLKETDKDLIDLRQVSIFE